MKVSKYNCVLYDKDYSYWYNTLRKTYFRLPSETGKKAELLLMDIEAFKQKAPMFCKRLCEAGFLVNDDVDELMVINGLNDAAVHSKDYFMVILPTLNCNFKCWYCIQNHIESVMPETVVEKIMRHIDYMVDVRHIESLHIDWFGGEPFMQFGSVIEPISRYAINKCAEAGIRFVNSATTNGYYLNGCIVPLLSELHFSHFQITIDGDRDLHNKVKYCEGCESAFDSVLKNINQMLVSDSTFRVSLRINYTHKNLTSAIVGQINSNLDAANRRRVAVVPRKVWQEKVDRQFQGELNSILDEFAMSGYKVQRWSPVSNFMPCYASKEYYNAINYNGDVVKCTACGDLYDKDGKGYLDDDGVVQWRDDFDKQYQRRTYDNQRCLECKWLPACMGLCPRDFLQGSKKCKQDKLDYTYSQKIVEFIDNAYV